MNFHIFPQKYIFFGISKKNPARKFPTGQKYNKSIGSYDRLVEWKEEEKRSYPLAGNPLCSSDAGA